MSGCSVPLTGPTSTVDLYKQLLWPFYNKDGGTTGCACYGSPNLVGNSDKARVINYLFSRISNPIAVAALAGNFQRESNFSPTSGSLEGDGVYGLVNWLGGRKTSLKAYAQSRDLPVSDLGLQLDYMWAELTGTVPEPYSDYNYKASTLDKITAAGAKLGSSSPTTPDPNDAVYIVVRYYEGAVDDNQKYGVQDYDIRLKYARDILAEFGNGGQSDGSATGCQDDGGIGTSPEGFVFPLKTTKAKIMKGVDGAVWCYTKQTSCHYDYNAADIHAETGTPVLAVRNGIVKNIYSGPARLVLLADNGRTYYYTHMLAGSIKVSEGKEVKAGDVIGSVGTNADAEESVRHLHIDELPRPPYDYRPGCRNAECHRCRGTA